MFPHRLILLGMSKARRRGKVVWKRGKKSKKSGGSGPTYAAVLATLQQAWEAYQNAQAAQEKLKAAQDTTNALRDVAAQISEVSQASHAVRIGSTAGLSFLPSNTDVLQLFTISLDLVGAVTRTVEIITKPDHLADIASATAAQIGLNAPEQFANRVWEYIKKEAGTPYFDGRRHYYFLYHPDNDWHAKFDCLAEEKPVPENFLGYSKNLDDLCRWMKFLRLLTDAFLSARPRFHILMPAYRNFSIKEPLAFPRELFPLTLHGQVHNQKLRIWMNLPTQPSISQDLLELRDVGNLYKAPWVERKGGLGYAVAGMASFWAVGAAGAATANPVVATIGGGGYTLCWSIAFVAPLLPRGCPPRVLGT